MTTVDILMMGPSRVGKTSLLTSMYEQLEHQGSVFTLHPDTNCNNKMQQLLIAFKKIFNTDGGLTVTDIGIKGGMAKNEYKFDINYNGKLFQQLNFIDVPGNWYGPEATPIQIENVKKLVKESKIIIIAIDSPSMMEFINENNGEALYMEEVNTPSAISNTITKELSINDEKLIILCPVKCETYVKDSRNEELLKRVTTAYEKLLNFCSKIEYKERICISITPIQTLGKVILHTAKEKKVTNKKGEIKIEPEFIFKVENFGGGSESIQYSPVNCDKPLKYILPFLLSSYSRSQWWWERMIFGKFNQQLKESVSELSKNREKDSQLIQGKNLL